MCGMFPNTGSRALGQSSTI